jgi:predicted TIM-barrel fold metal-dependent hydrolase
MSGNQSKIFLVDEHGITTALNESRYKTEADLQALLADNPDLLPGEDMSGSPQSWLLIAAELGVPNGPEASGKWRIDHLFVDEAGVPTLVECKRSSDPRARREVVAQMLDYAANGVLYWSLDRLRAAFEATWQDKQDPSEVLGEFLADNPSEDQSLLTEEAFWNKVMDNLAKRRVRLIFVADEISRELKRLVEFMNETMSEVEVLAVEIRHYWRDGHKDRVLVPSLVGATERANIAKERSGTPPRIDRSMFMDSVNDAARPFYEQLFSEVEKLGGFIYWGEKRCSVRFNKPQSGNPITLAYCNPPNEFQYYLDKKGVADERARNALRDQIIKQSGDELVKAGEFGAKCVVNASNCEDILKAAVDAFKRALEAFEREEGPVPPV